VKVSRDNPSSLAQTLIVRVLDHRAVFTASGEVVPAIEGLHACITYITSAYNGELVFYIAKHMGIKLSRYMVPVTCGRNLVPLADSRLGLSPVTVMPEDAITTIYGCMSPVILRRREHFFSTIGTCYMDGYMSDAVAGLADNGRLVEQEFLIR